MTEQNLEVAEQIVYVLEEMHVESPSIQPYLQSVGQLGYQIYLVDRAGNAITFGQPFEKSSLPDQTLERVLQGRTIWARKAFGISSG